MKDENECSPMMKQYLATKEQYKDCILFYRLGDFYEMFNEDAIVASKVLDLTLTSKSCGKQDDKAPMCGVPFHAYETYAQRLIENGFKVAICEQTSNMVNGVMKREVVRIITPGTVIDTEMLSDVANTYMMCIYKHNAGVAYAYGDLSTGEINCGSYVGENIANYINDQIIRIMPSEIICNTDLMPFAKDIVCLNTNDNFKLSEYYTWAFSYSNALSNVQKQYNLSSVKGFDFCEDELIVSVGALLEYYKETQKRELKHLKLPKLIKDNQFMYVDTNTRRNLEIEVSMHENSKRGSLLWCIDKTETSGGARLLRSWLRQPLQSKTQIEKRLDMVNCIYSNSLLRNQLKQSLSNIYDIERLAGKIAYGNVMPKDCLALSASLAVVPEVKTLIASTNNVYMQELANNLVDVTDIENLIDSTISEHPPIVFKDGGYIKTGFSEELDKLKNMKQYAENLMVEIQLKEREKTGIKNLKIGYNKVFGYYLEVNKMYENLVPNYYIRKQTISNNERYITEELKQFENEVLTSKERALALEEKLYEEFKTKLITKVRVLQQIASVISVVDCVYSLATTAVENDYVKPTITDKTKINIVGGRHPVVELINKQDFIPNDCLLNDADQRTIILTGPNMAGKSTYMRQVALITYLAHIGSFVPAESAEICIVDRIFTRIGASDDLAVGQSTFMVEMIEVANILNFCTNKSLIILDEVGRGTSTFDGLSIAWAVVEYLSKQMNVKTLFATHYHELMQLEGLLEGVRNYCISIKEIGGKLVFLRKIMRGSATKSYGIEVASLAGIPEHIIARAKNLMVEFEQNNKQQSVSQSSEVENILKEIDINKMTPINAFETISHLVELVKNK